jgi:hypothetical protein
MRTLASLAASLATLAASLAPPAASLAPPPIVLDARTASRHALSGIGGLSAGGTSRLLYDYAEPMRGDILDLLFTPKWGASLQILKVELPGDSQSTNGAEPSHMHVRGEAPACGRGYEAWLMAEAKRRNPLIATYALPWAAPRWVGDGAGDGEGFFSGDMIEYTMSWLGCVRNQTGVTVDFLGTWNEKRWDGAPSDYIVALRSALDASGFAETRIVVPDNGWGPGALATLVASIEANATYGAAVHAVGVHYACDWPVPNITESIGKVYWASEDWSTTGSWPGAGCWGRLLNRNFVRMNMTATIAWSLAWGANAALPFDGAGLMLVNTPWSGAYSGGSGAAPGSLDGPLWVSAHTTQFSERGWIYLSVPGGGSGLLPAAAGNGSYVTLIPPLAPSAGSSSDFTLVIEKLAGACLHCDAQPVADGVAYFSTAGGLAGPGAALQVWRSNETRQFWRDADITVGANSAFSVFVPRDTIVTVTTVAGGRKGSPASIPPPAPFPLPFEDDFASYAEDAAPRFFSDQQGAFAVRGGVLRQVVPADPGPNRWTVEDLDPMTLVGDGSLVDVAASVTAAFALPEAGKANVTYVQLCGRIAAFSGFKQQPCPGLCVSLNSSGTWVARAGAAVLASGSLAGGGDLAPFDPTVPRRISVSFSGAAFSGSIDGAPLFRGVAAAPFLAGGLIGLGSGYHDAGFSAFALAAAMPPATGPAPASTPVPGGIPAGALAQ